jgi:iron complex outermembrane receptor protein
LPDSFSGALSQSRINMKNNRLLTQGIFTTFCCMTLGISTPVFADNSMSDYLDLPLEDLLSIKVTTVSKKQQPLNEVASAVYVITGEDIKRSGVTSIAEALRMAPGIHVARIDANKWVITSRGFGSQFSNKLLVMIDGRTVYSPTFSGVYWDAQDTLLYDIDRIEVIRGPGATVWGANAVNGVINIITKNSSSTRGGLATAGAGNKEKGFASLRYGTELSTDISGKFYLKYNNRDDSYAPALGGDAGDGWERTQGGFRVDGQHKGKYSWTLQGDAYSSDENQRINIWKDPENPADSVYAPFYVAPAIHDTIKSSGYNLLAKWNYQISDQTNTTLQIYYDHTDRSEIFLDQIHDTLDIDFQHQFRILENHDIIWGVGYRSINDDFSNSFMVQFIPDSRDVSLYSGFVQDEIELIPQLLRFTLGSKFEHNDYTGIEIQPSARIVWLANEQNTLWGAISRAVRTPSRLEASSNIISRIIPIPPRFDPLVLRVKGNKEIESETVIAYELGYRVQPKENFSMDMALFYHDYDNVQTFEQSAGTSPVSDSVFGNKLSASSYGLEVSLDWRPLNWWRIQANYSFIEISSSFDDTSKDLSNTDEVTKGSSPANQFSLRSLMDLSHRISFDCWFYAVDSLDKTSFFYEDSVPGYTSFNMRLAWYPIEKIELSLIGQNLLDSRHLEFIGENLFLSTEVERAVYAQIRLFF